MFSKKLTIISLATVFLIVILFSIKPAQATVINFVSGLTTTGNVGIGTTSPGATLDVNGVIQGNNYLRLYAYPGYGSGSGTMYYNGGTGLFVMNNGLNVLGGVTATSFTGNGAGLTGVVASTYNGTVSSANVSSGTFGSNTGGGVYTFPNAVYMGSLDVNGSVNIHNGSWNAWNINTAYNYTNSDLMFNSAGSERIRVTSGGQFCLGYSGATGCTGGSSGLLVNGSVGIGTTAPNGKFQVAGNFANTGTGIQDGNDRPSISITGYYPQMVLMAGGTGNTNHGSTISLGAFDSGSSGSFKSWTIGTPGVNATYMDIGYGTNTNPHLNGISGYGTTVMSLTNTGSVGIGTSAPSYRLDVQGGEARISSKLWLDSAEGLSVYGIRGRNYNEQVEMYQKVSIGSPNGWTIFPQAPTFGLSVYGGANFATNQGNVGIGTTAPNGKLEIVSHPANNYGDGIVLGQVNGDNTNSIQTYIDDGAGGGWATRASYAGGCCNTLYIQKDAGDLVLGNSRGVTVTGTLTAGSFSGPMNGSINAANVTSGTFGGNYGGGNYIFPAWVGIQAGPQSIFDIATPTSSAGGNRTITIRDSSQGAINFGSYPGAWTAALAIQNNNNSRMIWLNPMDSGSGANSRLYAYGSGFDIYTGGTGGGTLGFSQNTSGNVGIGTAGPGYRLDVNGDINTNSYVYANELYTRDNLYLAYMGNWLSNLLNQNVRTDANPTFNSTYLANGNLRLYQGDGTGLRIQTAYGWMNIGAQNGSWTHIYSDKAFYMNQDLYLYGNRVYADNYHPNADYARYVYNNGAYSGSGWTEPSDVGVRYANYAASAGSASSASNADMVDGLHAGSFFQYEGFTLDANWMGSNGSGFTYSVGAPYTGPVTRFSAGGSYDLELNATYSGGTAMAYRTRNGDAGSWNSWYRLYSDTYRPYADSAGNSDTVDGYHVGSLLKWDTWDNGNYYGSNGNIYMGWAGDWMSNILPSKAVHRGEGNDFIDYSRYVYNNGAYSGSGWIEPSDLGVRYANSAGSTGYASGAGVVNGYGTSPDGSHPGSGAQPFYSWGTGCANNGSGSCYSNGITIGSHPGDPNYGFQIVENMWDDNLYFRRYNYGWDGWRTVIDNTTIGSQSVNYANSAGSATNAGNADTVDGYHGTSLIPRDTWWSSTYYGGDGNVYMGWDGRWLSETINQDVRNGSSPSFNNVYANSFQYSDETLKKNIATIDNPIDKIMQLRGVTFNWKKDDKAGVGVIAQEVERVYPELVTTTNDGTKAVQYSNLVAPLIEAVKAQQKEISGLTDNVQTLKDTVKELCKSKSKNSACTKFISSQN